MTLPQSIIDAFDAERMRFDGYKGPLFHAVHAYLQENPPDQPAPNLVEPEATMWKEINKSHGLTDADFVDWLRATEADHPVWLEYNFWNDMTAREIKLREMKRLSKP